MLSLKVTTNVENKEKLNSEVSITSDNSSFEEYLSGIIGIIDEMCLKSPQANYKAILSILNEYYLEKEKNS